MPASPCVSGAGIVEQLICSVPAPGTAGSRARSRLRMNHVLLAFVHLDGVRVADQTADAAAMQASGRSRHEILLRSPSWFGTSVIAEMWQALAHFCSRYSHPCSRAHECRGDDRIRVPVLVDALEDSATAPAAVNRNAG